VLGPVLIVVGAIFVISGMVSFFSAFGDFNKDPDKFWMCFAGMPIAMLGLFLTKVGFMGAAARFVAGEIAPVGKDTINYMARGTRGAVKDVTSAIAEGLREGADGEAGVVVRCLKCDEENDADAKFCNACGAAIRKTASCPECGELNDPDANFCDNCGVSLTAP
jgi:hypothetical protein